MKLTMAEMFFDILEELPEEKQKKYVEKLEWDHCNVYSPIQDYDINFLRKYCQYINWKYMTDYLVKCKEYDELIEIFREFKEFISPNDAPRYLLHGECNLEIINEFYDYFDFKELSFYPFITDDVIYEYQEELDWKILLEYKSFSTDMMRKMSNRLLTVEIIPYLLRYQDLSKIPEEFFAEIPSIINK